MGLLRVSSVVIALGWTVTALYNQHPYIVPLGGVEFASTYHNGQIVNLQWMRCNNSIADLWVRTYGEGKPAYTQLLLENVDLNVNTTFPWKVSIPNAVITNNNQFVLTLAPPNEPRNVYNYTQPYKAISMGFYITTNASYSPTTYPPSTISNTVPTGFPSLSLASVSAASLASVAASISAAMKKSTVSSSTLATRTSSTSSAGATFIGPPPASNSGLSESAKVGLGVGVGLGVLLIIAIALLAYVLRGRRRMQNQHPDMAYQHHGGHHWFNWSGAPVAAPLSELPAEGDPKELPETKQVSELPDETSFNKFLSPRTELDSTATSTPTIGDRQSSDDSTDTHIGKEEYK